MLSFNKEQMMGLTMDGQDKANITMLSIPKLIETKLAQKLKIVQPLQSVGFCRIAMRKDNALFMYGAVGMLQNTTASVNDTDVAENFRWQFKSLIDPTQASDQQFELLQKVHNFTAKFAYLTANADVMRMNDEYSNSPRCPDLLTDTGFYVIGNDDASYGFAMNFLQLPYQPVWLLKKSSECSPCFALVEAHELSILTAELIGNQEVRLSLKPLVYKNYTSVLIKTFDVAQNRFCQIAFRINCSWFMFGSIGQAVNLTTNSGDAPNSSVPDNFRWVLRNYLSRPQAVGDQYFAQKMANAAKFASDADHWLPKADTKCGNTFLTKTTKSPTKSALYVVTNSTIALKQANNASSVAQTTRQLQLSSIAFSPELSNTMRNEIPQIDRIIKPSLSSNSTLKQDAPGLNGLNGSVVGLWFILRTCPVDYCATKRSRLDMQKSLLCTAISRFRKENQTPCNHLSKTEQIVTKIVDSVASAWVVGTVSASFILSLIFKTCITYERILHMAEEIALVFIHILLIFFSTRIDLKVTCDCVAIMLHCAYVFLWVILVLEAIQTYAISTNVVARKPIINAYMSAALATVIPALTSILTACLTRSHHSNSYSCWLNYEDNTAVWITLATIVISVILSTIFLEASNMTTLDKLPLADEHLFFVSSVNKTSLAILIPLHAASVFLTSFALFFQRIPYFPFAIGVNIALGWNVLFWHTAINSKLEQIIKRFKLF